MLRLFCFLDDQTNFNGKLQSFIEQLDVQGNEIYLYTDITKVHGHAPSDILYALDSYEDSKKDLIPSVFLTNMKVLFDVVYRIYHQVFDHFIYYEQENVNTYHLEDIYQEISNMGITVEERLYKPIYTNNLVANQYKTPVVDIELQNNRLHEKSTSETSIRKYYSFHGVYYLLEPIVAKDRIVIPQGDFIYPGFENMQYYYDYPKDRLFSLFVMLKQGGNFEKLYNTLDGLEKDLKTFYPHIRTMTLCILEDAANMDQENQILRSVLLYSFLMQVTRDIRYINDMIQHIITNSYLSGESKFFLWNQCKRYLLENRAASNIRTTELMKALYHKAFHEYEHILASELVPISKEERNQDLIFVFTTQFLSERHAPTRTTLERCYTLGKLLGKRILLINTREQYTRKGDVMIHQPTYGNVIKDYDTKSFYEYKDMKIPFFQPSVDMPDLNVILQLLKKVREAKPWMIFTIGNGSIVADLCGRLVPEAAISVAFSKLATTKATFSVIGRKIAEVEWEGLLQQGYAKDNIIESTFTFELSPKVKSIKRDDYKIPNDRFVLITIGIRLDTEIQDDFIQMVQETFTYGTHIVFAGYFDRYQEYCTKYPEFAKNSTFVGYSKDILALMEICDLYVNPRRLGGGFSIIEAFHEGKPGVTTAYGDIAVAAGRDFCVQDYTEMIETIIRYKEDKKFYNTMAEKAKAREKVVTDSALSMRNIMKSIQESPLFF